MPRTKKVKNEKRARDATTNEDLMAAKLHEFDSMTEQLQLESEFKYEQDKALIFELITNIKTRIPKKMFKMTIGEINKLNAQTLEEFNELLQVSNQNNSAATQNATNRTTAKKSRDDEGYLTEDSNNYANSTGAPAHLPTKTLLQSIGPLGSSRARPRAQRSQSANSFQSAVKNSSVLMSNRAPAVVRGSSREHHSRSKYRTPLHGRVKAASAERFDPVTPKVTPNASLFMLRYPKYGETVISLTGSPVVAQAPQGDGSANVNIPILNGFLSLRPTKIDSVDREIINRIDQKTIGDLRQLQSNLGIIMKIAADKF